MRLEVGKILQLHCDIPDMIQAFVGTEHRIKAFRIEITMSNLMLKRTELAQHFGTQSTDKGIL
jgi:hypothetical protein